MQRGGYVVAVRVTRQVRRGAREPEPEPGTAANWMRADIEQAVSIRVPKAERILYKLTFYEPHGKRQAARSPGPLPTAVSTTRVVWTIALALYAGNKVEGDFVETGVFNGGTAITMLRVLDRLQSDKQFWACDSFRGLPIPTAGDNKCSKSPTSGLKTIGCATGRGGSYASTKRNFMRNLNRYQVGTARMHVVEGWFNETLPPAKLHSISFLRLDGDLYASTMDALVALYPLVTPGGLVYVDDYGSFGGCKAAVDEYRKRRGIKSRLMSIREDPSLNTRLFGFSQKDQRSDVFEAVWWVAE
eukprot:scaffold4882_cov70-Phaeocystis_antarctica.AAC.3